MKYVPVALRKIELLMDFQGNWGNE